MITRFLKYIASRILKKELSTLRKALEEKKVEVVVKEVSHFRMTVATFHDLKRKLPASTVTSATTNLQAAALVGQQQVLDILERDHVV